MNRSFLMRRGALLVAAVAVTAGAAWAAPAPKSGILQYDFQMTMPNQPAQKGNMKVWFKGRKVRSEVATPMGKQITLAGPDAVYAMTSGSKEAMKFPAPPQPKGSLAGSPFGDIAKVREVGKRVGKEKVGRYQTEIYEMTNAVKGANMPTGNASTRIWLAQNVPMPIKVVVKMPGGQRTMTLKSAQMNAAVPDSIFQLPKGTKITSGTGPQRR